MNKPSEVSQYKMPYSLTQDGIAMSLGISRAHASILMKKELEKETVEKILAHAGSGKGKRYVYFLTVKGIHESECLIDYARKERIDLDSLFMNKDLMRHMPHDPCIITTMRKLEDAPDILLGIQNYEYVDRLTVLKILQEAIFELMKNDDILRRV